MRLSALLTTAFVVGAAPAEEPPRFRVVENKVPAFTVVENRVPKATAMRWVSYTRAPVGHTHTCRACGVVWDHAAHAGHNCPNCGRTEFVQDLFPKAITLWRQVPADRPEPAPVPSLSDDCPTGH